MADLVCPQCGAEVQPAWAACWLCDAPLDDAVRLSSGVATPSRPHAPRREGVSYSLTTLMLVMTLAAVVCGVIVLAPGLGISMAILLAPVLVRTAMVVRRREAEGKRVSGAQKFWLIVTSLIVTHVILAVVTVAAVGTFCFVCLSGGRESFIPVALLAAAVVTIPVLILMFRWVRSRYRRDIELD